MQIALGTHSIAVVGQLTKRRRLAPVCAPCAQCAGGEDNRDAVQMVSDGACAMADLFLPET